MKQDKFILAMNYIDDSFIKEAEEYKGDRTMKKDTVATSKNVSFAHKYLKPILSVAAAFALILGWGMFAPSSNTDGPLNVGNFGVMVVSAAELEQVVYEVYDDTTVQLPVKAMLKVADIRNMNEDEAYAFQENMVMEMEKHLNFDDKSLGSYGYRCHPTQNAIVYYGYMNSFMLGGIDADRLSEIEINLDGVGELEINNMSFGGELNEYGKNFVISAEEYKNVYADRTDNTGNFCIGWMFGEELVDMFDNNPDAPLSDIEDTVTFTARYDDGTSEQFDIVISFGEDGVMNAAYSK